MYELRPRGAVALRFALSTLDQGSNVKITVDTTYQSKMNY